MDETELLKMAGLSTTGMAILLIVYRVAKSIVGKKLVSSCCGKRMEVGFDVATMTPNDALTIENPMKNKKEEVVVEIKNEKT